MSIGSRSWWPVDGAGPSADEIELLRAALVPGPAGIAAWHAWRRRNDPRGVPAAQAQLLPAVVDALPADEVASDDRVTAGEVRRSAWAASESLWATFERLAELVEPTGCSPVVVKGASPNLRLAVGAGVRAISDVDVVVEPRRFDDVLDLVERNGWRVASHRDPWSHALTVVAPDGGLVDLHRWVLLPRYSGRPESAWYRRTRTVEERGRRVEVLDPADELVLSVVHGLSTRESSSARWPLDVDVLVRAASDDGGFWDRVVESAGEAGVSLLVGRGLALCSDRLDLPVPGTVIERLAEAASPGERIGLAFARVRNNPPGLWTRYRRVMRAEGRRASPVGFARARAGRLRRQGIVDTVRNGISRGVTRIAHDRRR